MVVVVEVVKGVVAGVVRVLVVAVEVVKGVVAGVVRVLVVAVEVVKGVVVVVEVEVKVLVAEFDVWV